MRPAEFATAQDALGVSDEFLAARIGVHVNMIGRYGHPSRSGDVPERAAAVMRELLAAFEAGVSQVSDRVRAQPELVIPRYPDLDAFYGAVPMLAGWGPRAQGLMLAEVQRRLHAPIDYVAAS